MSTLNVSNITDGATTVGTSYVVNGSAKAWCHFTTVSSTAVNNGMSFNISSLTDTGTGDTDCNLISALTNSSIVAHCSVGNGSNGDQSFIQSNGTASMIPLYNYSGNNAVFDSALCAVSGLGDLA